MKRLSSFSQPSKRRSQHAGPSHPLYPTCNGKPWANHEQADAQGKVKRQFLEAYFQTNLAYARLVSLRTKCSRSAKSRERAILKEIERALLNRERLDDLYASRGVVATPVYFKGFTVDVLFNDVFSAQRGRPLIASSSSVRLTIPLPGGLRPKP